MATRALMSPRTRYLLLPLLLFQLLREAQRGKVGQESTHRVSPAEQADLSPVVKAQSIADRLAIAKRGMRPTGPKNTVKRIREIRLAGFEVPHVIHRHGEEEIPAVPTLHERGRGG